MNRFLVSTVLLAAAFGPARADMRPDEAKSAVAPFYKALNAEFAKESPELIRQAAAPEWKSCRGNDDCNSRDEVINGVGQRLKAIPNLKWEIKDVTVAGNQVTVRGEATGAPAGDFLGTPHTGKTFKVMSIDVHTIEGGKMVRTYHIEDWIGAVRQLKAN